MPLPEGAVPVWHAMGPEPCGRLAWYQREDTVGETVVRSEWCVSRRGRIPVKDGELLCVSCGYRFGPDGGPVDGVLAYLGTGRQT